MSAATDTRASSYVGLLPSKGTLPVAANVLILGGTIVCRDATGYAVVGVDDDNAFPAVGLAAADIDNRTTAPGGGAAGAENVEVIYGVHELFFTGSTPVPGQVVFVVDNQTVSLDSDSGTRGIAGYVSEVVGTSVYVQMGPTIAGQIVIATEEAADLDQAQIDILAVKARALALEVDAATANAWIPVPLNSFTADDGTPLAKFASGDNTTFGLNVADSETLCIRWNNHATPGTARCQVALPPDLDDEAAIKVEFLASKSGATIGDATTLTLASYLIAEGDLHDADTAVASVTNALAGDATAKTTDVLIATIAAGDVPAGARSLVFTATPTAGKLGADDLMVHAVGIRYTRKVQTA
jgi:hypothetical protein